MPLDAFIGVVHELQDALRAPLNTRGCGWGTSGSTLHLMSEPKLHATPHVWARIDAGPLIRLCGRMNKNSHDDDSALYSEFLAICTRHRAKVEPREIRAARKRFSLTQKQCGLIMATSTRSWQQWESGARRMKGRDWELFCLLTQSHEARAALLQLKIKRLT